MLLEEIKGFTQNPKLPVIAKNLLARLAIKELTLAQFLTECAYWALKDGFDELIPWKTPEIPSKVIELENMSLTQRLKIDYTKLYAEFPQIKDYYEKKFSILNRNKGVLLWLKDMDSYIPQEDTLSHIKIKNRILEFEMTKNEYNSMITKFLDSSGGHYVD